MPNPQHPAERGTRLEVARSNRKLFHYANGKIIKTYPVAVGKHSTPTPLGKFQVVNKIVNPGGALGTHWMGLNIPDGNYGIHGNNNYSSIGKFISNGCIRMYNKDVEELFPKISIGTTVIIYENTLKTNTEPGETRQHTVQPGDTLWKISQIYGVSMETLISLNGLDNPDRLVPGQILTFP